jgi:hypothetical protein
MSISQTGGGRLHDAVTLDGPDTVGVLSEHLGRRRFIAGVAAVAGAGAVASAAMPSIARALPAGASRYVPLPKQERFADTRNFAAYPYGMLGDGIRVQITGRNGIPANATAAVLTVTAVNLTATNYVSVYPTGGSRPEVSTLNMSYRGEVAANLATVQLGGGSVDLFSFDRCDMIVDVAGYYEPVAGSVDAGRFEVLGEAIRVIDTRQTGRPGPGWVVQVPLDGRIPANADSVVVNLTTTDTLGWGYFTCYPLDVGSPPDSSNLNVNGPGETRAAAAVVKIGSVGGTRGFNVFTYGGGHVIVDVAGYYTKAGSPSSQVGLFVPVFPQRILDTRQPGQMGRLWPRWVVTAGVPGAAGVEASAIVANVTAVDCRDAGYFTVLPAGGALREVSNLNADRVGQTIPNHVVTKISTRGVSVFAWAGAHVLIDLAGWFTGVPAVPTFSYTNPTPPAAGPPWSVYIPNLRSRGGAYGFLRAVLAGNSNTVVDRGNVWHWTGTGYMGQQAHVGLFAHRTEAGSPLYHQHELGVGDDIYVTVSDRPGDRRQFHYRVVRSDLTGAGSNEILDATRYHPGTTISLIACTKLNRLPTDLKYRLITTAVLVGVLEDGFPVPMP